MTYIHGKGNNEWITDFLASSPTIINAIPDLSCEQEPSTEVYTGGE